MSSTLPIYSSVLQQRARPLVADEAQQVGWLRALDDAHRARATDDMRAVDVASGERVVRVGRRATHWLGLHDGLLKMSGEDGADGRGGLTFTGLAPGGWFGEGTVLKNEVFRYTIQALRPSVVLVLPSETFHWLLDHSLGFNRFIMLQLNERLGQFIGAREIDRLSSPELRVARNLAALCNPALFPGVGSVLRITQQELAYLVGLSRQRVNQALQALQAQGWVQIEYGGLRVLQRDALRQGQR
ncbi:MAG: Crp/Fnr family transcriptional regulator [Burkholderiaceae bacterium]